MCLKVIISRRFAVIAFPKTQTVKLRLLILGCQGNDKKKPSSGRPKVHDIGGRLQLIEVLVTVFYRQLFQDFDIKVAP